MTVMVGAFTRWGWEILSSQNILSILVLPVFVKNTFYGFIGFDDCTTERVWSTDQLNVIQSLATNIANAIERINNEQIIKENENNFRQINETIEDVFWLYDTVNKKYLYISPSCKKVLGMSQEEFYSCKDFSKDFILEEDRPKLKAAKDLLEADSSYEVEYRIHDKEDEIKWIYEKSFAIRNDQGEIVRNSGICSDITEKRLIQTKLQQLSLVAEKTTNGILIADSNGYTLWANEGYLQMFEITERQLIGRRPRDLFSTDSQHLEVIDQLNSTNYTLEFEVLTYKKNKKWVELSCTAIQDERGEIVQQVEVLTDITEKIKAKNELKQHSLDLEFQNTLKEKLINAGSIKEITEEALGLIQEKMNDCIHISLLTLDEGKQYLEGYFLKGDVIEKESHPLKDIKSFEKIKNGRIFIESDLRTSGEISVSDKILLNYGAVSYAVIPILDGKETIGMITITFNKPFHLSAIDRNNLINFAFILSSTIRQLNLKTSLQERNTDINESLVYAQNIQKALLPDIRTNYKSLKNVLLLFKPKDIVSGDFYWAWEDNHLTYVAIGDCTGHGVPGAFLTLIGSRILEQIVSIEKISSPAEILARLDKQLYVSLNNSQTETIGDGMEIAICVVDKSKNNLTFSGAGIGLLYFDKDNAEFFIQGRMGPIGEYKHAATVFEDYHVDLSDKKRFYLASDGYQDQLGSENYKRFSRRKLEKLLKQTLHMAPEKQEEILNRTIVEYIGQYHQLDDITILGFTI